MLISIDLSGGSDGGPDDVDFTHASPPIAFTYYSVEVNMLRPNGAPVSGGTRVTLFGSGALRI